MPRRNALPVLASLDRHFGATLTGEQVGRLPPKVVRKLVLRGILASAGEASTIPYCICEERHPDCVVDVDSDGGEHRGRCGVYGVPVAVCVEQVRRYRFAWRAWVDWLRRKNALTGPDPVRGVGTLFVGNGEVGGREFALIVVAPGCQRAADVAVPEVARQNDRALVALVLGEPAEDLHVGATFLATALGADFGTIDESTLEHALDAVPVTVPRGELQYMLYRRESPRGKRVDEAEYDRLSKPQVRAGFDLFIDLPACAVWRKGRRERWIRNAQGKSKKKKLGPLAVRLLADYVRRPHAAMTAKQTPTYRISSTDPHSATVQLGEVRRSVRGKDFIRPGARSDKFGELPYLFEPGDMTWCLLDRPGP